MGARIGFGFLPILEEQGESGVCVLVSVVLGGGVWCCYAWVMSVFVVSLD